MPRALATGVARASLIDLRSETGPRWTTSEFAGRASLPAISRPPERGVCHPISSRYRAEPAALMLRCGARAAGRGAAGPLVAAPNFRVLGSRGSELSVGRGLCRPKIRRLEHGPRVHFLCPIACVRPKGPRGSRRYCATRSAVRRRRRGSEREPTQVSSMIGRCRALLEVEPPGESRSLMRLAYRRPFRRRDREVAVSADDRAYPRFQCVAIPGPAGTRKGAQCPRAAPGNGYLSFALWPRRRRPRTRIPGSPLPGNGRAVVVTVA